MGQGHGAYKTQHQEGGSALGTRAPRREGLQETSWQAPTHPQSGEMNTQGKEG